MKTGRNEPCPCGSGQKYKNCHADKTPERLSSNRIGWIVVAIVAVGAISLFASLRGEDSSRPTPAPATPQTETNQTGTTSTAADAIPTDPPPGKVWSEEHGHWHDKADSSQIQLSTSTATTPSGAVPAPTGSPIPSATAATQPPGPAPAGKVWSPEHGHWHDDPANVQPTTAEVPDDLKPLMKSPGIPDNPEGLVWSEEHKHWHDAKKDAERKAEQAEQPTTPTEPKPDDQ